MLEILLNGVAPMIIYQAQSAHILEIRLPHVMHGAWLANAPLSTVNTFYGSLTVYSPLDGRAIYRSTAY